MFRSICVYILLAMVFAGCRKEAKPLFDKTSDERVAEALAAYQQKLSQAPGWKVFVYPKGLQSLGIDVGGFTYYMKFTGGNRVTMVSDFDSTMASMPKEGGYRLKALQRPSIFFDTYSYLHVASDPTNTISKGPAEQLGPFYENGHGWGSDFDFAFTERNPRDTINLKGNFNESDAVMIRVSQAEMDSVFNKGRLRTVKDTVSNFLEKNNYIFLPLSNGGYVVPAFDRYLKVITFFYVLNNITTSSMAYSITASGVHLKEPVTFGVHTFQDFFWDSNKHSFYVLTTTNRRIDLAPYPSPILSLPLADLLGDPYTTISVPPRPLSSQSATFTAKYNQVKASLKSSAYNLEVTYMLFIFDTEAQTMTINVYAFPETHLLTAQYVYAYTKDNSDFFKFTRKSQNTYGKLLESGMRPLLDYIETDQFELEGLLTSTAVLGQFTSRQRPDFSFTGNLY